MLHLLFFFPLQCLSHDLFLFWGHECVVPPFTTVELLPFLFFWRSCFQAAFKPAVTVNSLFPRRKWRSPFVTVSNPS